MDYPTTGNPDHSERSMGKDTSEYPTGPMFQDVTVTNTDMWLSKPSENGTPMVGMVFRLDTIYTTWILLVFIIAVETFLCWRMPSTMPCPIAAWEDVAPTQARFSVEASGSKDSDRSGQTFLSNK